MSQIPSDYNFRFDDVSNYDSNQKEVSDLQSDSNFELNQTKLSAINFSKIAHTEESILRSAILSDHLTDTEFKKNKWKEAVENTGRFGKLKYKWNKVKSSVHAFINGFESKKPTGNLKSRENNNPSSIGVFVKNKEINSLPTLCSFNGKKGINNVSKEMLSLYMDGIELGDVEGKFSKNSTSSQFFSKNYIDNNSKSILFLKGMPFNFISSNPSELNKMVDYGQLGGETSIESELETISRRLFSNSSPMELNLEGNRTFFNNLEENSVLSEQEDSSEDKQEGLKTSSNNSSVKKKILESSYKNQEVNKDKFQFFKGLPPFGLPLLEGNISGDWKPFLSTYFRIPQSGSHVLPIVNFSSWGKKSDKFLDISYQLPNNQKYLNVSNVEVQNDSFSSVVSTGISDLRENIEENNYIDNSSYSIQRKNNLSNYNLKEISNFFKEKQNIYLVSSVYSFSSFSGFSAESLHKKEEEKLLAEQKRAALEANVLVYQYRTIGLNPPIILRPPSTYVSYKRSYIKAKPSLESVHNDLQEEKEFYDKENKEDNSKK